MDELKRKKSEKIVKKSHLFTPAVLIALITAIVGPVSLLMFEDINQKRKLQEQLLTKIFEHAIDESTQELQLERITE